MGPGPLRRLLCVSRRTTGPFAERWCVLGTFPSQPNSGSPTRTRLGSAAKCSERHGRLAGGTRLLGKHLRPPPFARRSRSVRPGRRGQIGSILRDLPRCIRGDRGPAGRRQLSRRHTERSRSPDAKRGVTETRRAPKRLVDASPRTAAADAKRGVSKCSSPGASSRATGARRRRTRPGSTPTLLYLLPDRPLEASRTLMILKSRHNR